MTGACIHRIIIAPQKSVEIITAFSAYILYILTVEWKGFAVPEPSPVVYRASVLPVQEWTSEYQRTALSALHAVSLSYIQLPGYVSCFHVIKENSSYLTLQIP